MTTLPAAMPELFGLQFRCACGGRPVKTALNGGHPTTLCQSCAILYLRTLRDGFWRRDLPADFWPAEAVRRGPLAGLLRGGRR